MNPLYIYHRLPHPEAGIPHISIEISAERVRRVALDLEINRPRERGTESETLGLLLEHPVWDIMVATEFVTIMVIEAEEGLFDA